jgi:hypothetical protein
MQDYEIRYLKPGGSLALIFKTACADDGEARETAKRMLKPEHGGYEIWRDMTRIDTFTKG